MCNFMYMHLIPLHGLYTLFVVPLHFHTAEKTFKQKEKLDNSSSFDVIFIVSQTSGHAKLTHR